MKKIFASLNRLNLGFLILGITLMSMFFSEFVSSFYPVISFEDLLDGVEIKKGSHVEGNVLMAFEPFASETTYTKNKSGQTTSTKASGNYYVIPMGYDNFIGLKTNQSHVSAMNRLVNETYNFFDGGLEPTTEVFIQGMVKKMDKELVRHFRNYMIQSDFTEEEINAMGTPLYINYTSFKNVRISFTIGVALTLAGIGLIFMKFRKLSSVEDQISPEKESGLEL